MLRRAGGVVLSIVALLGIDAIGFAQPSGLPEMQEPAGLAEELPDQTWTVSGPEISLDELVQTALRQNPSIQAAMQTVEARKEVITSEKTLPNPTLSFQTMGNFIPPTLQERDPSSGRFYSIEQEFPFPGKLGLRGKIASTAAEAQQWNYEQVRRQVVADLKKAYYDYYFLFKSIEVVNKDSDLLQNFEQVAEAKYRVGQGAQQDVLKAQVEVSKLIDRRIVLEQRIAVNEALINNLLYRPPGTAVGRPGEITRSELPYSLDELFRLARQNSPALNQQEQEIKRNELSVRLAQKEFYPDFTLGFTYVERDDIREMYGLTASVKAPLYFWRKQRPELNAARLGLESAKKQRESTASTVAYNIRDSYVVAKSSDKLLQLYSTTLVPQARLSVESAFSSYQVGTVDFLTLLDSVVTLLEYELKYYESLANYQKALAQLEPIVGVELIR